jgi:hypothetical protein
MTSKNKLKSKISYNSSTMNKRGDIPITILVVGVLFICGMALFTFYFSNDSVKKGFNSVEAVEQAAVIADKIILYENLGFEQTEIDEIFDIKPDTQGRYFVIEKGSVSVRYNLGK